MSEYNTDCATRWSYRATIHYTVINHKEIDYYILEVCPSLFVYNNITKRCIDIIREYFCLIAHISHTRIERKLILDRNVNE